MCTPNKPVWCTAASGGAEGQEDQQRHGEAGWAGGAQPPDQEQGEQWLTPGEPAKRFLRTGLPLHRRYVAKNRR